MSAQRVVARTRTNLTKNNSPHSLRWAILIAWHTIVSRVISITPNERKKAKETTGKKWIQLRAKRFIHSAQKPTMPLHTRNNFLKTDRKRKQCFVVARINAAVFVFYSLVCALLFFAFRLCFKPNANFPMWFKVHLCGRKDVCMKNSFVYNCIYGTFGPGFSCYSSFFSPLQRNWQKKVKFIKGFALTYSRAVSKGPSHCKISRMEWKKEKNHAITSTHISLSLQWWINWAVNMRARRRIEFDKFHFFVVVCVSLPLSFFSAFFVRCQRMQLENLQFKQ